eukprot:gene7960-1176_t
MKLSHVPVTDRLGRGAFAPRCSTGRSRKPFRRTGRTHALHVTNMLGFDFGDNEGDNEPVVVERSAMGPTPVKKSVKVSSLNTLGASLLVYSQVLKGSVGEAFLLALSTSIKYQAPAKDVLGAYARFFSLLQTVGNDAGWEDYVLDQILMARDNSFARAVAQTGKLDPDSPALKGVAYDLDVLQQLCIPMKNLAEYIGDAAPIAGPYFVDAASSASMKPERTLLENPSGTQEAIDMSSDPTYILAPPTADELAQWKSLIASKVDWSEAVPLLQLYYARHGFGITSRNSALRWSKGAFEEGYEGNAELHTWPCIESQRAALAQNTTRFCEGHPAQHVLVAGPSGSGKSWLLWESTLAAGKASGVRLVDVSSMELSSILEVARGAGRYPRVRFILVADNASLPVRNPTLVADLMAGLSGSGGSGWPSNCLLYMAASPDSTVSVSDPVVARFGMLLTTGFMSEAEFQSTLETLSDEQCKNLQLEEVAQAINWANQRGGLTLRAAAQFMKMNPNPTSAVAPSSVQEPKPPAVAQAAPARAPAVDAADLVKTSKWISPKAVPK